MAGKSRMALIFPGAAWIARHSLMPGEMPGGSKMTESIKNRVAIIGMGCTKFGELWGRSVTDLMVEAAMRLMKTLGSNLKMSRLPGWEPGKRLLECQAWVSVVH